jgi:hypothetical protein
MGGHRLRLASCSANDPGGPPVQPLARSGRKAVVDGRAHERVREAEWALRRDQISLLQGVSNLRPAIDLKIRQLGDKVQLRPVSNDRERPC